MMVAFYVGLYNHCPLDGHRPGQISRLVEVRALRVAELIQLAGARRRPD
jgi:hypothetical protein